MTLSVHGGLSPFASIFNCDICICNALRGPPAYAVLFVQPWPTMGLLNERPLFCLGLYLLSNAINFGI